MEYITKMIKNQYHYTKHVVSKYIIKISDYEYKKGKKANKQVCT